MLRSLRSPLEASFDREAKASPPALLTSARGRKQREGQRQQRRDGVTDDDRGQQDPDDSIKMAGRVLEDPSAGGGTDVQPGFLELRRRL